MPAMLELGLALRAWGTPDFESILKLEVARQADRLPLQQGLMHSSSVVDVPVTVMILGAADLGDVIRVKAGIFYLGIVGGCSCADDPTPLDENSEYCEVLLEISKASALATVVLAEK